MIRKLLVVAAAAAMPVSIIAATGSTAGAKTPPVDATHYTVSCTGLTGSAKFSPPLTLTSSGVETVSLKAVVSGCTATPTGGGSPVAVSGGKISGTLVDPTSNWCAALFGGVNAPMQA